MNITRNAYAPYNFGSSVEIKFCCFCVFVDVAKKSYLFFLTVEIFVVRGSYLVWLPFQKKMYLLLVIF